MADDWEAEDWEREDFKPKLPATAPAPQFETAGEAILARATGPDPTKFADEDAEEDDDEGEQEASKSAQVSRRTDPETETTSSSRRSRADDADAPAHFVRPSQHKTHITNQTKPKNQQPRKPPAPKKYADKEGMGAQDPNAEDDTPLDDPLAERLRRQRLVEESDLRAARELFGTAGGSTGGKGGADGSNNKDASGLSEQARLQARLDGLLLPKALKEFEEIGSLAAKRYVLPHAPQKHYKALIKALLRAVLEPLTAEEARDIETCAAAVRAEKVKADKAAAAARASKGRRAVNAGAGGGAAGSGLGGGAGKSAGLDEYVFDDAGDGDDFDFM